MYNELPERVEKCHIFLKVRGDCLSKADCKRMKKLGVGVGVMGDTDTLEVTYNFGVEYYNVIAQFSLILDLLDKAHVSHVKTEELQLGKCLIQELLCKLEQLEGKFKKPW